MREFGRYRALAWRGATERVLEVGDGPGLLVLPALFAEANRTRAFTIETLRRLAGTYRCVLPDLPGTLESTCSLPEVDWSEWCAFAAHAADDLDTDAVLAIRGGALLSAGERPRLHFAPTPGTRLLRDLLRARMASDREAGTAGTMAKLERRVANGVESLAGFSMAPQLSQPLAAAEPVTWAWTIGLADDPGSSDVTIAGTRLWRRAEPGRDDAMAAGLATAVIDWRQACDAG